MKNLDNLKHIRRELRIILDVVTQQRNVITQMMDDLKSGQFKDCAAFQSSGDIGERWAKRIEKINQRRTQILDLDDKAQQIFNDVSTFIRAFSFQSFL
jgi:hypothetical protein